MHAALPPNPTPEAQRHLRLSPVQARARVDSLCEIIAADYELVHLVGSYMNRFHMAAGALNNMMEEVSDLIKLAEAKQAK